MRSEIVISDGRVYHLGLAKDELAPNVFLVGDPARACRVSKRFDSVMHEIKNREYVTITGEYRGIPVSVIGTGIGTDNVEIALTEAYIVNEFDFETGQRYDASPLTIIRIGTSGGVQPDTLPGTMAIAEYALGLDSTGIYYESDPADAIVEEIEMEAKRILEDSVREDSRFKGKIIPYASKASKGIVEALELKAGENGADFESGITVSAPGFYGPSSRFIDGLKNTFGDIKGNLASLSVGGRKVINMEMESSLLFHMARAIGYRAGTICPMISNPDSSDEIADYETAIEQAITIGLDAMVELRGG